MAVTNLPTDVLRTFLAVIDLGSFTKAGQLLGRTQPAISLQIRKLEELIGVPLLDARGRTFVLSKDGEALARYARQLLVLNDEIVTRLQKRGSEGRLHVGLPTDYAVAFFQKTVAHYSQQHPEAQLSIYCDVSKRLMAMFADDELDLVIAMYDDQPAPGLIYSWVERPIWTIGAESDADGHNPLPLAVHPEGCHYRSRMIRCLDQIGRPWRIIYCSPGISGLQQAVQSGIGITALTRRTLLRGMRVLKETDGFPPLADIHLGLHFKNTGASTAALMLVNHFMQALHDSGQTEIVRMEKMCGSNVRFARRSPTSL
jgi:DNA-binding transcriptional LysR family regulator